MAVTFEERWTGIKSRNSASAKRDVVQLSYIAKATEGEEEPAIRAAASTTLPDSYSGLGRDEVSITRLETDGRWDVTASYKHPSSSAGKKTLDVDEVRWSVRSGGGVSQRAVYSLGLISETPSAGNYVFSGTAMENVIGLKLGADGNNIEVEGVDVQIGVVEIEVETTKSTTQINAGYLINGATYAANQVVNSDIWNGFAIGTMQLQSFSSVPRNEASPKYDIQMSFIFSPNLTNIAVGDLTVAAKTGHDLLDVLFTRTIIAGNLPMAVPVRAAVHRMNPWISFASSLGI